MKKRASRVALAVGLLIVAFARGALAGSAPADRPSSLTVGMVASGTPPFLSEQGGQAVGIGADFLHAMLGNVHLTPRSFPDVPSLLQAACSGEVDVTMDLAQTEESSRCLVFSAPYFDGDLALYGRAPTSNGSIAKPDEKVGRFAVEKGFLTDEALHSRFPNAQWGYVNSAREGLAAVASGRADFYIAPRSMTEYVLPREDFNDLTEISVYHEPRGAMRFGLSARWASLAPDIDAGLASMPDARRTELLGNSSSSSLNEPSAQPAIFLSDNEREFLSSLPTLRVGFNSNIAPYAYLDAGGRPIGIATDYLAWLNNQLGLKFQIIPLPGGNQIISEFHKNAIDMSVMTPLGSRAWKDIPTTRAYVSLPLVIIGRESMMTVDGLRDLDGERVIVVKGSGLVDMLHKEFPKIQALEAGDVVQSLSAVEAGRAEAFIGSLAATDSLLRQRFDGRLRVVGLTNWRIEVGFGLSPSLGARLAPLINRALDAMPEDQRLEIYHRYVSAGYLIKPTWRQMLRDVAPVIGVLLLAVVILLGFLIQLIREARRRLLVEAELSATLQFQRTLLDAIPVPIVVKGRDGQYLQVNAATERLLLGASRADRGGEPLPRAALAFWGAENMRRIEEKCQEALRTGQPRFHILVRASEGLAQERYYLSRVQPYGEAGMDFEGVICTAEDVTEIRQIQARLIDVTQHLPVVVFQGRQTRDAELELQWVSGSTDRLFGLTADAMLENSARVNDYVHPDHVEALRLASEASLRTQQALICELRLSPAYGSRWTRLHALPSAQANGGTYWNGYWADMTESYEQMRVLSQARDAAEAASRAKDSFLALMSHEIRTPMSGVLGLIELLSHSPLSQEQGAMVGMIEDSAGSLMQILDDILDYSKIEAGKIAFESEPVDVRELCDLSIGLLAVRARDKDLRLRTSVDERVAAVVLGDGVRLRQILFNLLSNAIKFTDHGTVSLSVDVVDAAGADQQSQRLRWRVSDTGIGVQAERQAQLFEPFVQADISTTRRFGGSGLGLSICRRLVAQMGGEIALHSEPGQGTEVTVYITLPVNAFHYADAPLRGVRAGVVLEDALVADALVHLLRAAGARAERSPSPDDDLLYLDESLSGRSIENLSERSMPDHAAKVILVTERHKPIGYRLADDEARLSVNPLRWRGLVLVSQAVLERSESRMDSNARNGGLDARADGSNARTSGSNSKGGKPDDAPPVAPLREDALKQGQLILIAEDHVTNRLLLQRQLAMLGYTCDAVSNGEEALAAARRTSYALLITDCHMPGMNGYSLAQRIREDEAAASGPRLPIIAVTASTESSEVQRCLDAGMDETLLKPVTLSALRECLASILTQVAK